jgi:tetratricopeptide (TPR) repeat protein
MLARLAIALAFVGAVAANARAQEAPKRPGAEAAERGRALADCRGADVRYAPTAISLCSRALRLPGLGRRDRADAHRIRAQAYFRLLDHGRAWSEYDAAIRADPRNAAIRYERARLFRGLRDYLEDVLADCAAAIRLDPRHAEAYALRADLYEQVTKDFARAIADLTVLMRLAPARVEHRERRGRLYGELGRWRESLADFSAVLAKANRFESRLGRARAHAALGDAERALADLDAALRLAPGSGTAWRERARLWAKQGDHDRAAADFAEALALDAGDLEARRGLAEAAPASPGAGALRRCFLEAGEAARAACTAAAAADGAEAARRGLALYGRARHRLAAEDWAGAVADATAAAELRAGFAPAVYLRARARLEAGDYAAAITDLLRAGIEEPERRAYYALAILGTRRVRFAAEQWAVAGGHASGNAVVLGVGGAIRAAREDRPGALAAYRRALALDGTLRFVRRGLARLEAPDEAEATRDVLACETGADAIAPCDRVIADETLPARRRAWAHVRRGDLRLDDEPAAALADFEAALALADDLAAAQYGRGAALLALQRHDDALAAFSAALARDPGSGNARIARAGVLHSLGRDGEALADADRAVALRDDSAVAFYTRARIHERLGNVKEARADFEKALELEPRLAEAQAGLRRLELR